MKPPVIALNEILELAPACLQTVIPGSYADSNGHMNMRWYVAIFDEAGDELYIRLGLTPDYNRQRHIGTFDLEHHTHFLHEVMPGDRVAVYARICGYSAKRIHYLMFLVNETRDRLSAIFECVNGLVDLSVRRTVAYPPEISATSKAAFDAHAKLEWAAPVSGVMRA